MDFNREFLFFFSALGVFNGLVLSIYFLFLAKPKHTSHFFIGFLFFFLSIRIGKSLFYYFYNNLSGIYLQIGLTACWFLGPFLYFYIKQSTNQKKTNNNFWVPHLILLFTIALLVNLKYPWEKYKELWWSYIIDIIHLVWLIYIIISGLTLYGIFSKTNMLKQNKSFKLWILSIYFGNAILCMAYILSPYTSYIIGAVTFTLIFYLLLILILLYRKREMLLLLNPPKYGNNFINEEEIDRVIKKFEIILRNSKAYKKSNISIKHIASEIGVSSNRLSQILNMYMNVSFPNIIGKYRVEEAKKMIIDMPKYSIESIGYECGFNSKSSFYKVFKKHTGMTPLNFKKSAKYNLRV
jgi:AraC-like DNA-binding protein